MYPTPCEVTTIMRPCINLLYHLYGLIYHYLLYSDHPCQYNNASFLNDYIYTIPLKHSGDLGLEFMIQNSIWNCPCSAYYTCTRTLHLPPALQMVSSIAFLHVGEKSRDKNYNILVECSKLMRSFLHLFRPLFWFNTTLSTKFASFHLCKANARQMFFFP